MIIEATHLTKRYVGRTAVDDVSFSVGKGEIVGFLGPNGAGKTTTMRMLTSYLPPTSGSVRIAGFDVFRESIQARRRIGYMPENVPLYDDMTVREYLRFRAALKGIRGSRPVRHRVGEVMEQCGLTEMRRKLIGSLSKGYRQRVGLADALLHKPDLLILDEPTNGLDPNQIRQVRALIRDLGREHTILLSTHILPEVEVTCDRVMILHNGRIKASDTPQNLITRLRTAGTVAVEIKAPAKQAIAAFRAIPGVRKVTPGVEHDGWLNLTLRVESKADRREDVFAAAVKHGWPLRELCRKTASLEDVFVEITQDEPGA